MKTDELGAVGASRRDRRFSSAVPESSVGVGDVGDFRVGRRGRLKTARGWKTKCVQKMT
jgi:hypothetical protein